jgi:hypothetical protein
MDCRRARSLAVSLATKCSVDRERVALGRDRPDLRTLQMTDGVVVICASYRLAGQQRTSLAVTSARVRTTPFLIFADALDAMRRVRTVPDGSRVVVLCISRPQFGRARVGGGSVCFFRHTGSPRTTSRVDPTRRHSSLAVIGS